MTADRQRSTLTVTLLGDDLAKNPNRESTNEARGVLCRGDSQGSRWMAFFTDGGRAGAIPAAVLPIYFNRRAPGAGTNGGTMSDEVTDYQRGVFDGEAKAIKYYEQEAREKRLDRLVPLAAAYVCGNCARSTHPDESVMIRDATNYAVAQLASIEAAVTKGD